MNCPVNFDNSLCWPSTERNKHAYLECPGQKESLKHYVSRLCMSDGKWSDSVDYGACSSALIPNQVIGLSFLIFYSSFESFLFSRR